MKVWAFWACFGLCAAPAASAEEKPPRPTLSLPAATQVLSATRAYPLTTAVSTNHAGWREAIANVNTAQTARVSWHVNSGGETVLQARPAWDPSAAWQDLKQWSRREGTQRKGQLEVPITVPTLLRLRVRGPKFPLSGIAQIEVKYVRHTVAVLRGEPSANRRPVIVADGYDPFNELDLNDPDSHQLSFIQLVNEARTRDRLDPWVLDWGDGGARLEQQAEDFTEIARLVKTWNGGRPGTVAVGISMGAVSLRYALAKAAASSDDLGVLRYVSLNGPHQGAWVSPEVLNFVLKGANKPGMEGQELKEALQVRRGLDNPAIQQLLFSGARHSQFFADLRSLGERGYHPGIPRVAFSNGTMVNEKDALSEPDHPVKGIAHRVRASVFGLPFWFTVRRTRTDPHYQRFPGEQLPEALRLPVRDHRRILSLFRFDWISRWESVSAFIPTHSALDFPEELDGDSRRYRYTKWRESAFPTLYVAPGRNLAHDVEGVLWINPHTGKGAPDGRNVVLYEINKAYSGQ